MNRHIMLIRNLKPSMKLCTTPILLLVQYLFVLSEDECI